MKINGTSGVKSIKDYNNNTEVFYKKKKIEKAEDSIQISTIGKNLTIYSVEEKFINSNDRVYKIKKQIEEGNYRIDSKSIAKKILESMKEKSL